MLQTNVLIQGILVRKKDQFIWTRYGIGEFYKKKLNEIMFIWQYISKNYAIYF